MMLSHRLLLASASAALLALSFPGFNYEFLAWVALVPLYFAIEDLKPSRAFFVSYLCGIIFFAATIYWLVHVTLPGTIGVILYLAVYFGLFGIFAGRLSNSGRYASGPAIRCFRLAAIPAMWVSLELARSHFITGFGWNLLGYSQSYTLPVIQIADFTGPYGVSFLIVLVNTAVFLTIKEVRAKNYLLTTLALALFFVFAALYYGTYRVRNIFAGDTIKVSVVQGNIPQLKKWDPSFKESILEKYERLTERALAEKPDIIIWPETSVPGFMESEEDLMGRVSGLSRSIKTPLLVGAPREEPSNRDAYYNSAILLGRDAEILGRYDKIHLVPFGEYVPMRAVFSFVENFAPSPIGDFSSGKDHSVFEFFVTRDSSDANGLRRFTKKVRFSALICFEDIFPGLARRFVLNGAGFLVNMTNDAWFGKTCAAEQHAQSSVFRAVENRVNVIRAANTGISCIIDQKGRIVEKVSDGGEDIFVEGVKSGNITLTRARTFYTVYGDVFAYACAAFALACLMRGRKR